MQMNFSDTPLDAKTGETLYLLVYTGEAGVWYSPVEFSELAVNTKEDRWGHGDFFDVDHYTLVAKYHNEKGKEKEIKVKWSYSKKEKVKYKKSRNFVYLEDVDVTRTKIEDGNCFGPNRVYITKDIEKMKEYVKEKKIFENAIMAYNKRKQETISHCDEQINRIAAYSL